MEVAKTFFNELRSSATGSQALPDRVSTPAAVARTRSSSLPNPYKARLSHSSPSETAPRWSSSNLAADASSTYSMEHTATTKQPSSYNFFPLLMHINEIIPHRSTTSQTNVGMCNSQDLTDSPYRDLKRCNKCWRYLFVDPWHVTNMMPCLTNMQIRSQKQLMSQHIFWLNPTSVEGSKTFINELRSSATGSQALPDRVSTPPAAARTRSSSLPIPYKARLSHSLPCETAPRRSSSNLAADASSTCGIRHTATTKPPSSYNFFPLLMHINEIIPHRSTTSQTNVGMCNSQDLTDSPYRDLKRCNKCWRYLFVDPWHVTNMMPCLTNMQIRSQKQLMSQHIFWLNPTSVEGSKTFINELRSSATGSQFRLECVCTPPAVARTRSSSLPIPYKARLSHSLPCETTPRRSSSNLAADASSTYSIRNTATTKRPSSYNIAPCDKHSNSVTKTTHVTTHFLVEPNLRGRFQDFHQWVAQFCYRQPSLAGSCLHTTRSSQDSKLLF